MLTDRSSWFVCVNAELGISDRGGAWLVCGDATWGLADGGAVVDALTDGCGGYR